MSYHLPPHLVDHPVTETATLHITTGSFAPDASHSGHAIVPSILSQTGSNKKRRPSKGKVPAEIRRSSSTPHMRNLALATAGELSPTADKRRNKLGYHRTSVACGHCRRRKIRCLVAQDDPQRRCSNCIRLKKECNFYPVDQTPETQRSHTKTVDSSTPSSPRHSAAPTLENGEEPPSTIANLPPPAKFTLSELDIDATQPQPADLPLQPSPYSYSHPGEPQWTTPNFLASSAVVEGSPPSTSYWRPSPSTAASTYGSDTNASGGQTPATMSTTSNMSYHDGWNQSPMQAPPTRSMSYGNIEGLHHYPNQGASIQHREYRDRTASYPYPPSIDTNTVSMQNTSLGDTTTAPLSAPIVPSQPYGYPTGWNGYHMQASEIANPPTGAQWYSEPVQLDQVQEEGGPPSTYHHGPMQAYYSGH